MTKIEYILVIILLVQLVLTFAMIVIIVRQAEIANDIKKVRGRIYNIEKVPWENSAGKAVKSAVRKGNGQKNIKSNSSLHTQETEQLYPVVNTERYYSAVNTDTEAKRKKEEPISKLPEDNQEKNDLTAMTVYVLSGLSVNHSVYYNQMSPVKFDVRDKEGAVFLLYSDMTVKPSEYNFRGYNKTAYYNGNDFSFVYQFIDEEGDEVGGQRMIKLQKISKPAVVKKTRDGIQLVEKGILIVEVK